jgi:hypothetical protein
MAEYDSNMIKPVESLQNFSRLNPTGRREERKRRQQLQEQNDEEKESSEDKLKENIDEYKEEPDETPDAESRDSQNPDSLGIDFRA